MSLKRTPFMALEEFKTKASAGPAPTDVVLHKFVAEEIKVLDDSGVRRAVLVASTPAVDREGDTVSVDGWDTENYLKNPVILLGHDYRSLPIARCVALAKSGGALKATIEWPPEGKDERADAAYQAVKDGRLKGVSVGFRPIKSARNEDRGGWNPTDFIEQELLEISLVSVPANPEALVETVKGLMESLAGGADADTLERAIEVLKGARRGHGVTKGVVCCTSSSDLSSSDTWKEPPLADFTDKKWADLTAAEKKDIADCYAYAPADPPEKFEDLVLPHHDPKTKKLNRKGLASAAGRFDQTEIPAGDKPKVKARFEAHYHAIGEKAPWEAEDDDKSLEARLLKMLKSGRVLSEENKDLLKKAIGLCKTATRHHAKAADSHEDAADALQKCMKHLKDLLAKAEKPEEEPEDEPEEEPEDEGIGDEDEEVAEEDDDLPDGDQPDAQAGKGNRKPKAKDLVAISFDELLGELDKRLKDGMSSAVAEGLRAATGRLD